MVRCGFCDVRAKTRALATESAYVLNSAPGVIWFRGFSERQVRVLGCLIRLNWGGSCDGREMVVISTKRLQSCILCQPRWWSDGNVKLTFPGASMAPPMTTTSLTFKKVSGSCEAAMARFVNGPTATIVIVSGSFSLSKSSITSCAGLSEGVKRQCSSLAFWRFAASAEERSFGVGSNSDFHVSAGERWGC